MIKNYPYRNVNEGNVIMPTPSGLNRVDILHLEREGIGIRLDNAFYTENVTVPLFTYQRLSQKQFGQVPVRFFERGTIQSGGNYIRKYTIMGGSATSVDEYSMLWKGVDVRYVPQPGDALSDVASGLADAINNSIFPVGYSATATSIGPQLTVTFSSAALVSFFSLYNDNYKFESGYYCILTILGETNEYWIEGSEGYINYPDFPTLQPSYAYSTLEKAPNGMLKYLQAKGSSSYITTRNSFFNPIGTIEISSVPFYINSSRAVYDQPNSRIVFPSQTSLKANERLLMLYR
ncbi:MAG: hypothetical protein ACTHMM_10120 [Agriterribacter sp.]